MINLVAILMIIAYKSTGVLLQVDDHCVSTAYSLIMVSFIVVTVIAHSIASNIFKTIHMYSTIETKMADSQ